MKWFSHLLVIGVAALGLSVALVGCESPVEGVWPAKQNEGISIYVVDHGWHTGLVLPVAEVGHVLPELKGLGLGERDAFIEIGWGDRDFYRTPDAGVGTAAQALFASSGSVLHVVAVPDWPDRYFRGSKVQELRISPQGKQDLLAFVRGSFVMDEAESGISLGKGLYGRLQFYEAKGAYAPWNTCNHWTAAALRSAGLPITPFYAATAGNLNWQLQRVIDY